MNPHRRRRLIGAGLFIAAARLALGTVPVRLQESLRADVVAEITAQIDKARDLLREEGRYEEALNLLTPLLARLMSVPDSQRRIDLSAEIFLLRGMAAAGTGDDAAARREFRSLFELGLDVARAATRNIFDPKIVPLLKQVEREVQGLGTDYTLGIVSDPPGARVRIDGRDIGSTPVLFQAAGPGKISVDVDKVGYQSVRDEVMIDQPETRREYPLTFVGLTLRIQSEPPGAAVFLDGRDIGRETNAEIPGLPLGPHRIRLMKSGYRDWETTAEAASDESLLDVKTRMIASRYVPEGVWGGLESSLLKSPTSLAPGGTRGEFIAVDESDFKIKAFDESGKILWSADPGTMAELGLLWIGGLIVDGAGNIIISDPENHLLLKLNPEGKIIGKWGSFGSEPGEFNTPLGLAGDETGRIYVADSGNHRVSVLSPDGNLIQVWEGSGAAAGRFRSPRAVAVSGTTVHVLDADRIWKFALDGTFLSSWELRDAEGGPIGEARALAVDGNGCVFLTDPKGSRVLKYDAEGILVCAWGRSGVQSGELGEPWGVGLDDMGRVFVVERGNHRIQIFAVESRPPESRERVISRDGTETSEGSSS